MLLDKWQMEELEIGAFIEDEIRCGTYCEFVLSIPPTKERWRNRLIEAVAHQDRIAAIVATKYWRLY